MNKTQLIHNLYHRANSITDERRRTGASLDNYDYLNGLARNFDAIAKSARRHDGLKQGWFVQDPVANIVATTVHKAMISLIPSYGLGDFDWAGVGEDLDHLCLMAYEILRGCDEEALALNVCHRHNLFTTMCELQERLDEQSLTDLAND
jgi:hypothetical protein